MGFCYALKHEVDDLDEAWDFAKKDPLGSDDDENENNDKMGKKELKAENLGQANNALLAHTLIVSEIKKKIDQE